MPTITLSTEEQAAWDHFQAQTAYGTPPPGAPTSARLRAIEEIRPLGTSLEKLKTAIESALDTSSDVTDLATYVTESGTGTAAIRATITSPSAGDHLVWDGTDWVNEGTTIAEELRVGTEPSDYITLTYSDDNQALEIKNSSAHSYFTYLRLFDTELTYLQLGWTDYGFGVVSYDEAVFGTTNEDSSIYFQQGEMAPAFFAGTTHEFCPGITGIGLGKFNSQWGTLWTQGGLIGGRVVSTTNGVATPILSLSTTDSYATFSGEIVYTMNVLGDPGLSLNEVGRVRFIARKVAGVMTAEIQADPLGDDDAMQSVAGGTLSLTFSTGIVGTVATLYVTATESPAGTVHYFSNRLDVPLSPLSAWVITEL
jgi:hypothetical protein